jgi:hypothetical protein
LKFIIKIIVNYDEKNRRVRSLRKGQRKMLRSCLGVDTSERGEDIRNEYRRVNIIEILCTHV